MGIIELYREVEVEVVQGLELQQVQPDHVLEGAGNEKILLPQPKHLALKLLVVGIQDLGDILRLDLFRHRPEVIADIEVLEVETSGRLGTPQPEAILTVLTRYPGTGVS